MAKYVGSDRYVTCDSSKAGESRMSEGEGEFKGAVGSENVKLVRNVRKRYAGRVRVFDIEDI